jgi:hypothetical protein
MTLLELQRRTAAAIMAPAGPAAKRVTPGLPVEEEAEALIKPNDRLTSMERLAIYRRSYWSRLLDSFREDFPGLCGVLGQRAFNRVAESYLTEVPSRSFTMRDLGSRLEAWLRGKPGLAGKNPELALDMVRLEWARIEAYDGEQRKALGPEDLLEIGPEMRFGLQPYMTLLQLSFPADDLLIRVEEVTEKAGAGTTIAGRRQRAAVRRCGSVASAPTFLAVHRVEFTVYYKRLTPGEFRILVALRDGRPLADALAGVSDERAVEAWFTTWSRLGWLCSPERQEA